jgi:predicted enzyme related to lactoylglutathione lyase
MPHPATETASEKTAARPSHVGICVSDLKRAQDFYASALGFTVMEPASLGSAYNRLLELDDDAHLSVGFLSHGDFRLELLQITPPIGDGGRRAMNRRGLTHLSVAVDSIDAMAARITTAGGQVVEESRFRSEQGEFVFCMDPDGTRIELMQMAESSD